MFYRYIPVKSHVYSCFCNMFNARRCKYTCSLKILILIPCDRILIH